MRVTKQVVLAVLAACVVAPPTYAQTVVSYGSGSIASSVPSIMNDNDAYYAPTPANMEAFYSTLNIDPALKNKAIPTNRWWTWLATGFNKDGNGNWYQGGVYGSQLWAYPGVVVPETYGMDIYFPNSWQARTNPNSPDGYFDTNAGLQIFGNVTPSVGAGDVLLADFDGSTYPSGWTVTGTAFGTGPIAGGTWSGESPAVTGYIGNACVNTYRGTDGVTGTLTGPAFTVNDNYIDLLVSGGNTTATEIELIVGGNIVDRVSGQNSNTMAWTQWNVTAYKGQSAQIKIVDNSTGGWGHVAVSWIVETNTSTNPPTQYTSTFKVNGNPIVTGYGDWTLDYRETDGKGNQIDTTLARGVPFVWARYTGVKPTINWLPNSFTLYDSAGNVIDTSSGSFTTSSFAVDVNGRTYGVFAPTNTTFNIVGSGIQAQLASPGFLVYGFLPDHTYLSSFATYAYTRPTGSTFAWTYDIPNGLVKTTWNLTTSALQGTGTSTLQGWLPHHYRTTSNNLTLQPYTYLTPRGTMKVAVGNSWQINFPFRGIAPVLPAPHQNGLANDFNLSRLTGLVNNFAPYHPGAFDETYGGGKEMAISAQYMTMADQLGMSSQANNIKNTMETRFADWLSYTSGKPQHFFARYPDWGALIGYGASYGTQGFNDNHFHYGYWTLSAALLGMEDHTWLTNYSPMMTQILKEYANWDRTDTSYPFMRTFDVWEGHSWAGGTSSPGGENQESSSEAMNSWVGMFMLGSMTSNSTVQAAGAMGYAIESSAVNEYWQDMYQTNFPSSYGMGMNGVLGSGGLTYGTFFTADPAWIYGIQMVPSNHWNNYLARNKTFAANQLSKMWTERASGVNGFTYTGTNDPSGLGGYLGNYILGFQLLFDPDTVASTLDTYNANNDPVATDGTYAGEIYYQTHALRGLGDQDLNYWTSIPTSQVYLNSRNGVRTAVIYNPSSTGQTATIYNSGTAVMSITVPAYQTVSQIVGSTSVAPSTPTELSAQAGKARVNLYWAPSSGSISYNVYMGTTAGGESATPVLTSISRASCVVTGLTNGTKYYFKVAGVNGVGTSPLSTEVNATPTAPATGPYGGTAWAVPGTIEAENFDTGGQGVGYNDSDTSNNGGKYRTSEGVDIENVTDASGTYDVGYTVSGEWMNYTVNAANPGQYTVSFRIACPNDGRAFHLADADGNSLTGSVSVPNTGGFQAWANVTATMILPAGQQTLTLVEDAGGFNLNFMTFAFTGALGPPVPTGVTATPGNASVTLAWATSTGATSYNVYRGTTAGAEVATAIATGITSLTFKNTGLTNGTTYYYKVTAVNSGGESEKSAEVSAAPSTPHATFVKIDSTTQGNWRDVYGVEGYNVIGDSSVANPHYKTGITVTPGTHSTGLWAPSSLAPGCLQPSTSGNPNRLAGVWFQTSWTLNVNAVGSHTMELYLLDFPNAGYAETITIKDATTGAVLDTRSASNFAGGAYYVWTVSGNVNITFTSTAGHWAVVSGIFFGGATGNKSPTQPTALTATPAGSGVNLSWTASTGAVSYNVYRGTTAGGESTTPIATGIKTTSYSNVGLSPNTTYFYKVVAVNTYAGSFASMEASATTLTPAATVTFVKTDTTTKGTWKGVYGVDGYNVIGDTSGTNPVYPSYATVTPSTHSSGVWVSTTALTSCLQKVATASTDRMAGVWYNTNWTLNANITGSHQLALYFLDYPNAGYAETVTIKDAATGFVLDTRSVSAFTGGVYEVWTVSGNITVTLTSTAGHWAVLSGIFFK